MWGQFAEHLKARIEASDKYQKLSEDANPIALLKVMQNLQCQQSELDHYVEALTKAEEKFYFLKQHGHESDSNFYEIFKNSKNVRSEVQAT